MYFNKLHLSFILGAIFLAQPAIAENHTTTKKSKSVKPIHEKPKPEKQQSKNQQYPDAGFKSNSDAISYALGASIGRSYKRDGITINQKFFIQGLEDTLSSAKLKMSEKEFKSVLAGFQTEMRNKIATSKQEKIIQNQKKADEFFARNSKKEGVVTLPSGIQYKILKPGSGEKPTESDIVEVNYRGSLLDGTEFDASPEGKPANLKLARLIAGWKEALGLMPVGSKWQLFIPPKFAYGERGVGSDISPNEMLIFEVELLGIKK
jgi:FKBP-type peptidyl-prolyl cis-trans isomerase FklB